MAVYADGMRKVASCAAIFWHGAGLFVLWYKEVGHHAYRTTLYSIRTPQNIKLWPIPHITHPKIKYFWRPRTTTHPPKRYFSARAHHPVLVCLCVCVCECVCVCVCVGATGAAAAVAAAARPAAAAAAAPAGGAAGSARWAAGGGGRRGEPKSPVPKTGHSSLTKYIFSHPPARHAPEN